METTPYGTILAETVDDMQAEIYSLQMINAALRQEIDALRHQDNIPIQPWEREDKAGAMIDYNYERNLDNGEKNI